MKLIVGLSGNLPRLVSGHSFDTDYESFYRPFLKILYAHPKVSAVIYFSGLWYKWFDDFHPEVNTLIAEMQRKSRQVEILGGGYYDPFLPMLQAVDRVGQLDALTTVVRQKFGKKPRGCRLGRDSWDNSLIASLKSCGIEYVFLDKSTLMSTSQSGENSFQLAMTEEQGKILRVFPIADEMIAKASECTPDEFIIELLNANGRDSVVSLFFDADNFKGIGFEWLEEFFTKMAFCRAIEPTTAAQYLKSAPVAAKEYYQSRFIYKKILLESEEFDNLYSKMSFVQTVANSIRGDKYKKKAALDELWKGQGYLSSFSGGMGCRAYSSFIECEKLARSQDVFIPSIICTDFKLCGGRQYLYQGSFYNAYVQPEGGSIFEYDDLQFSWNYISYCKENVSPGLFQDSFYDAESFRGDVESIRSAVSDDLSSVAYDVDDYDRDSKMLAFSCRRKSEGCNIRLMKRYRFLDSTIAVKYEAVNVGGMACNFGCVTSFNIVLSDQAGMFKPHLSENGIAFEDRTKVISISADRDCDFTWQNIFDSSCAYVSTLIYATWKAENLEPAKSRAISFEFSCR